MSQVTWLHFFCGHGGRLSVKLHVAGFWNMSQMSTLFYMQHCQGYISPVITKYVYASYYVYVIMCLRVKTSNFCSIKDLPGLEFQKKAVCAFLSQMFEDILSTKSNVTFFQSTGLMHRSVEKCKLNIKSQSNPIKYIRNWQYKSFKWKNIHTGKHQHRRTCVGSQQPFKYVHL